MYQKTRAFDKLLTLTKRIRGISGGTGAGKTVAVLLWLIDYCQTNSRVGKVVSVVSESFPHLKRGAMRDFMNIMETHDYFVAANWNKSDSTYTFETTKLEFFSVDQPGKVRGPRRDILFINESNNISFDTYDQLEIRTKDLIWMDWNPVSEFWWYTEVLGKQDVDFITLTYKDNQALDKKIVETLESRRHNKNWWRVYGLGRLGTAEGRIYSDWELVDIVPHQARLVKYGLDFGFSSDPAAAVAVYEYNGGFILDEVLYARGLTNRVMYELLSRLPKAVVVADSAEPKSIAELKGYGLMIVPAEKGKDSVRHGIQYVQEQKISVTKSSLNLIKEYRNYLWITDRDGKTINEPGSGLDDLLDATRYAITSSRRPTIWIPGDPGGVKPYIRGTLA